MGETLFKTAFRTDKSVCKEGRKKESFALCVITHEKYRIHERTLTPADGRHIQCHIVVIVDVYQLRLETNSSYQMSAWHTVA